MSTFTFELVTPEKLAYSAAVELVVVPGADGDFGAMVGHSPLISLLRPGVVEIHEGGAIAARFFVAGGFAEVSAERCTVLAEETFPLEQADRTAALGRLEQAQRAVQKAHDEAELAVAEKELAVAQALAEAV